MSPVHFSFHSPIFCSLISFSFLFPINSNQTSLISVGMIVSWGIMLWNLAILLAGRDPPFAIVFHGSMGPAFNKGDVLWLQKNNAPVQCGEIVVFKVNEESIPVVHRAITVLQKRENGEIRLLTKGDNNDDDDRGGTYTEGRLWLTLDQVYGRVRWYAPYVGWGMIYVTMQPFVKYPLIAAIGMCLFAVKRYY